MTYIIIAALALVVLVVIILFFTGGIGTLFDQQKENIEGVTDQDLEIWRGQCKMHCTLEKSKQGNCPNFCNYEKEGWSCNGNVPDTKSLGVSCGSGWKKEEDSFSWFYLKEEEQTEKCVC